MSIVREAKALWSGNVTQGEGYIDLNTDTADGRFTLHTRLGDREGTAPEQLLAGAHAGCYAMSLAKHLADEDHTPSTVDVSARVYVDNDHGIPSISGIAITAHARALGLNDALFEAIARRALDHSPMVRALSGTHIDLAARYTSG